MTSQPWQEEAECSQMHKNGLGVPNLVPCRCHIPHASLLTSRSSVLPACAAAPTALCGVSVLSPEEAVSVMPGVVHMEPMRRVQALV